MNFFDKLLGKEKKIKDIPTDTKDTFDTDDTSILSFEITFQKETDPYLKINPRSITHAFIVLTVEDVITHSKMAEKNTNYLLRQCQPKIWNVQFRCTFPMAFKKAGVVSPYSVLVNNLTVSFDGGKTESKIYVCFTFAEKAKRIILADIGTCIPI